ncbi:MAG: DNA recombination protein RmuC [Proteobacteria bacterium]|nr:DNA recombination protein RmuC [Pseudomonadota bacterium]
MNINLQQILIFSGAFVLGLLTYWLYIRSRTQLIIENEKSKLSTKLQLNQQKLGKLQEYFVALNKSSKQHEQDNVHLIENNKSLITDLAVTKQQLLRLKEIQDEVSQLKQGLLQKDNEHLKAQTLIAELQTLNTQQQKAADEKLELLNETKEELKLQFKNLANDIFEEKDKKYSAQNKEKLDAILNPFSQQLDAFKKKIDDVYHNEGKQRASLITEVKNLRELNQQLNTEAKNLTRALKGDKKLQGNWGELILERVLEQSGLRKGHEYDTQGGFRDAENNILKPDVIIHLPQDKDIIVDSKVSLVAYENYASAESKKDKAIALKAHMKAIKNHIKSLSEKDYSALSGVKTLDFVLMFIPIEPAFMVAFQQNDKIFVDAFSSKIVVVTPTTLLATLKTIENLWRYEKQNQNARDIADRAANIYDKFRGFIEDIEKLGKQLDTTQSTYHDALNKLTRGRGNLVHQAQQLLDLGVKVKKEIPKSMLEKSDLEKLDLEKSNTKEEE